MRRLGLVVRDEQVGAGLTPRRKLDAARLEKRTQERVRSKRWLVVRFDGAVLGGSEDQARAESIRAAVCEGRRADYAVVMRRKARR